MATGLNLNNKITWAGNDKPKFQTVFSGKTTSEIKNMTKEERISQLRNNSQYNTGHTSSMVMTPYTEVINNKTSKKPDTEAMASQLSSRLQSTPVKPERISQNPNLEKKSLTRKNTSHSGVTPNNTYNVSNVAKKLSLTQSNNGKFISGTVDQTFPNGADYGFDSSVYAIAVQADGKILVGGDFGYYYFDGDSYFAPYLIRLNPDGTVDTDFSTNNLNGAVYSIAIQPDGKILLGGGFNYYDYDGNYYYHIIRINSDGSPDYTFPVGGGFNNDVYDIQLQSDGKILVGGVFSQYNGYDAYDIIRLNSNGSIDSSFLIGDNNVSFDNYVNTIKIQPDGKILVGGAFNYYGNVSRNYITRLNSNGTLDTTFVVGNGFNNEVYSIDLQSDGKIIVGGNFGDNGYYDNNPCNYIVRLNTDGSLNSTFGFGVNNTVNKVLVQSDDKILVAGYIGGFWPYYNSYYTISADELVRYNADTTIDWGFYHNEMFGDGVYVLALNANNEIYVGGDFTTSYNSEFELNYFGRLNNYVPKYKYVYTVNVNNNLNSRTVSVGSNTLITLDNNYQVISAKSLSNPSEIIIGQITLNDSNYYPYGEPDYVLENLYDFWSDAYLDNYKRVNAVSLLDGETDTFTVNKLYEVGDIFFIDESFVDLGDDFNFRVRSCFEITSIRTSYSSNIYKPVPYVPYETCEECVRANGVVYEYNNWDTPSGGAFVSNQYLNPDLYPAVILPNTPTHSNFVFDSPSFFNANDYQGLPEYKSLISFTYPEDSIPPTTTALLQNVKGDGQLDYTFNYGYDLGGFNDFVHVTKLQSDGKILVGGQFDSYNGINLPGGEGFVRLNTDGSIDESFAFNFNYWNNYVYDIELLSDGGVLISGALNYGGLRSSNEWIDQINGGDATINREANLWTLTGPNDGQGDGWSYVKRQFIESGYIVLNYDWSTNDGLEYDWPFYYVSSEEPIGDTNIDFNDNIFVGSEYQTGQITIYYNAGDWVSIGVYSDDSVSGPGVLKISEYTGLVKMDQFSNIDTTFNDNVLKNGGFSDNVWSVVQKENGKILVAGDFVNFGNYEVDGFVQLNSDGTIDEDFLNTKVYFNDSSYRLKLQSDGKILVGGDFEYVYDPTTDTEYSVGYLTRLNEDGSLDLTFNATGVYPVKWNPQTPFSGVTAQYLRWTITGVKGNVSTTQVSELYLTLNGQQLSFNGLVATANPDGTNPSGEVSAKLVDDNILTKWTDTAFSANGQSVMIIDNQVPINFDGYKYYTGNDFPERDPISWTLEVSDDGITWTTVSEVVDATITDNRKAPTGIFTVDPIQDFGGSISFNGKASVTAYTNTSVWDIEDNDFTIEWFQKYTGITNYYPTAFDYNDGNLTVFFDLNQQKIVIFIQGDTWSFGLNDSINRWGHFALTRLYNGVDYVWKIFQNGNELGTFNYGVTYGQMEPFIIGNTLNGGISDPFVGNITNFRVNNGYSYYNSNFTPPTQPLLPDDNQDGNVVLCLLALNSGDVIYDSCDDHTVTTTNYDIVYSAFNSSVYAIEIDNEGKILVGGDFNNYNGNYIGYGLARLNTDGTYDDTLVIQDGFNNSVNVIRVQPDGKLLVGGYFTYYYYNGGRNTWDIARLNADGSPDDKFMTFVWGEGFTWGVRDIAIQDDGNSIVGGWFTGYWQYGGQYNNVNHLCRLYTADQYQLHDFTTCDGMSGYTYTPFSSTTDGGNGFRATPITYELISTGGLDLVYDGNIDDDNFVITLPTPFDVNFLGVNYSSVNVSTNPYITFGVVVDPTACCFDIPNQIPDSGEGPQLPGVFVSFQCPDNPGDYDGQMYQLYSGLTDGGNTMVIKYIGTDHCDEIATLVYGFKFYKDNSDYFDLIIESNDNFFNDDPTGGISDGVNPTWVATFDSTGGNAYRIGFSGKPTKANIDTDPAICGVVGNLTTGYTMTDGSMYFSGDDVVRVNLDSDFQLHNGDFTIEWFQKRENNGQNQRPFSLGSYDNPTATIAVSFEGDNNFTLWLYDTPYNFGNQYDINYWVHFAITKQNNIVRVFRNGVQIGEDILSMFELFNTSGDGLTLGNEWSTSPSGQFQGNMTNFRWTKGFALYTSNFEVPREPLSPMEGTKLLMLTKTDTDLLTDSSGTGKNPYSDGVGPVDFNTDTPFYSTYTGSYSENDVIYDDCLSCTSTVSYNTILGVTYDGVTSSVQRFTMTPDDINKVETYGPIFTTTMSDIPRREAYHILGYYL